MTDTTTAGFPAGCVPDEAILAAARVADDAPYNNLSEWADEDGDVEQARAMLAAAAPHLVAHALHHLVDELVAEYALGSRHRAEDRPGLWTAVRVLRDLADVLGQGGDPPMPDLTLPEPTGVRTDEETGVTFAGFPGDVYAMDAVLDTAEDAPVWLDTDIDHGLTVGAAQRIGWSLLAAAAWRQRHAGGAS